MTKNLQLIANGQAVELKHDRGVERSDVAVPHIACDASEEDVGVTPLEAAHHRHFGNGMALTIIFPQKERVNASGIAAHDYVLVVVGKNLRLDKVAWA